jgi:hypothetical protein
MYTLALRLQQPLFKGDGDVEAARTVLPYKFLFKSI